LRKPKKFKKGTFFAQAKKAKKAKKRIGSLIKKSFFHLNNYR